MRKLCIAFAIILLTLLRLSAIDGESESAYWYFRGVVNNGDLYWSQDYTIIDQLNTLIDSGNIMERGANDELIEVQIEPMLLGTWFVDGTAIQAYGYTQATCFIVTFDSPDSDAMPVIAAWVSCDAIVEIYRTMHESRAEGDI